MNENSFFSIDKLVEFGMGFAVAQQMVQMMNHTMQNMHIAGTQNPMSSLNSAPTAFFVVIDGQQAGPFSESEILQLITQKKITNETYVWHQGMQDWKKSEEVPAIVRIVAINPPPFNK